MYHLSSALVRSCSLAECVRLSLRDFVFKSFLNFYFHSVCFANLIILFKKHSTLTVTSLLFWSRFANRVFLIVLPILGKIKLSSV